MINREIIRIISREISLPDYVNTFLLVYIKIFVGNC